MDRLRRSGSGKRSERGYVPRECVVGVSDALYRVLFGGGWKIFWKLRHTETGILEVNFVTRTPDSAPRPPYGSQVGQIFGRVCDHVESEPMFVSGLPRTRYWVFALTANICRVQPLLLSPTPKCGCDSWLDSRSSAEVYEGLREWLKGCDQS